jgi:hypothetical protein
VNTNEITHFLEIDFRYGWLSTILEALETGLGGISMMGEDVPWFDGGWEIEYSESVYGIAFVSAQTYILGTTQDVNKIRQHGGRNELDKIAYYSDDPHPLENGVSRLRLINSIANYYKHQDEWSSWPSNYTTKDLAAVNIGQNTDFPCYEAALKLWPGEDVDNLQSLLPIVSNWRTYILNKYKER